MITLLKKSHPSVPEAEFLLPIVPSSCHRRFPLLWGFLTCSCPWAMPLGRKTVQAVPRGVRCKTDGVQYHDVNSCNWICSVIKESVKGSVLPMLTFTQKPFLLVSLLNDRGVPSLPSLAWLSPTGFRDRLGYLRSDDAKSMATGLWSYTQFTQWILLQEEIKTRSYWNISFVRGSQLHIDLQLLRVSLPKW